MCTSRWSVSALCIAAAMVLSGCASLGPVDSRAADVARAARGPDRAAACADLAPGVVASLTSDGQTCEAALEQESLEPAGTVRRVETWGDAARVTLQHDVVYLSVFGSAWKVTAMGCTPVAEGPDECSIEGS